MNLLVFVCFLSAVVLVNGSLQNSDEKAALLESGDHNTESHNVKMLTLDSLRKLSVTSNLNDAEDTEDKASNTDMNSLLKDLVFKLYLSVIQKRENLIPNEFLNFKRNNHFTKDLELRTSMNSCLSCEDKVVDMGPSGEVKIFKSGRSSDIKFDFERFLTKPNSLSELSEELLTLPLIKEIISSKLEELQKIITFSNIFKILHLLHPPRKPLFHRSLEKTHKISTRQVLERPIIGEGGDLRIPQSVAGSSLYGSYAYAHVSPFGGIEPIEGGGEVPEPVEGVEG